MLPDPALAAPVQRANAAAAIAVLHALRGRIAVGREALAQGVRNARLAARLQRFVKPGAAELIIDVAHNPQAARVLAQWLQEHPAPPRGRNLAVFGALADKDVAGIVAPLAPYIARWLAGGLDADTPRGLLAADLAARMTSADVHAEVERLQRSGRRSKRAAHLARGADRILAFGSFFVAAAALAWAGQNGFRAVDIG